MVKMRENALGSLAYIVISAAALLIGFVLRDLCIGHQLWDAGRYGTSMPVLIFALALGVVVTDVWLSGNRLESSLLGDEGRAHRIFIRDIIQSTVLVMTAFLLHFEAVDRIVFGVFFAVHPLLSIFAEALLSYHNNKVPITKGVWKRSLLIIGSKQRAREMIGHIAGNGTKDVRIVGALEVDRELVGSEVALGVKVIGLLDEMETVLRREVVDEVVFTIALHKIPRVADYLILAEEVGATVRILPDWQIYSLAYSPKLSHFSFEAYQGLPTMTLVAKKRKALQVFFKDAMDLVVGIAALAVLWPLILAIALLIKRASPGPAFFRQRRVGLHGRRFTMLKFRTMLPGAEDRLDELMELNESDGPTFKIKDDPRIIPGIGKFLRKTGLDELPQIINVIRGEMSLVGPRPPIPDEVGRYQVPQLRRLSIKPGLTCFWQSTPNRNRQSFEQWVVSDLNYIDNWTLWMDFKILCRTVSVVLRMQGQ